MKIVITLPVYFKKSHIVTFFRKEIKSEINLFHEGDPITLGVFHSKTFVIRRIVSIARDPIMTLKDISCSDSLMIFELIEDGWQKMHSIDLSLESNIIALKNRLKKNK